MTNRYQYEVSMPNQSYTPQVTESPQSIPKAHGKKARSLVKRIFLAFIAINLALVLLQSYLTRPTSIGPKLEYVGKHEFGCALLILCFSPEYEEYYYATDLTQDQLKSYFTKAAYEPNKGGVSFSNEDFSYDEVQFNNNGQHFQFSYYKHPQNIRQAYRLETTSKPYIISVTDWSYKIAKDSL